MKRRALDFTSNYRIEVVQSSASGKYWSQLADESTNKVLWMMEGLTDSRSEAFDLACNRLDALAEQYVSEGEPEDDGAGISEQEHCQRNGVPWCPKP